MHVKLEENDKIERVKVEPKENGWELEVSIKRKMGDGVYDNFDYMHKEYVFTDEETEDLFKTYKELMMKKKEQLGH